MEKDIEMLRKSVQKWHDIVEGDVEFQEEEGCPLCQKFLIEKCPTCPLYLAGGIYSCWNDGVYFSQCNENTRKTAEEMVNMLETLLCFYERAACFMEDKPKKL